MAPLSRGLELLEIAVGYALTTAGTVTPQILQRPTPCRDWDVEALLNHVGDSITAIRQALATACIGGGPTATDDGDPVARLRDQAAILLGECAAAPARANTVDIGGMKLAASMVVLTGALEIGVHGWDISVACGVRRPVPPTLAAILLPIAPLLITAQIRPGLFADPVDVPASMAPGDRLVAFLGRDPATARTPAGLHQ